MPTSLQPALRAAAPLERPAVLWSLGLLTVTGFATAWYLRRFARRSGRLRLRWGARLAVVTGIVTLLASFAAGVNDYVGYFPTIGSIFGALPASAAPLHGQVRRIEIPAPALRLRSDTAYVYLPPGYAGSPNRRYPVVYLFHGWPGSAIDWLRGGEAQLSMDVLINDHVIAPTILVAPSSGGGWLGDTECLDWAHGPRLETYLTSVVVPVIDHNFRTVADRNGRAIGGFSSGAFCAVNLGLRHLREFSTILAIAPYAIPGPYKEFGTKFGTYADYLRNLPLRYLPHMRFPVPTAAFIVAGRGDGESYRDAARLAAALRARGQRVQTRFEPGTIHTWRGARDALPYALMFAEQP